MTSLRIVAISGGLSVPSTTRLLTDNLIEATRAAAQEHHVTIEVDVIELRELTLDVAKVMVTGMPEPRVESALDSLENADGLIAVTPIYAGSYAGVFKSFVDLVGTERLAGTPVVLGATGGSARHSMALEYAMRPLFTSLRAHSLPTGIFAASEDFGAAWDNGRAASALASRVARAGAELVNAALGAKLPPRHVWEPSPTGHSSTSAVAQSGSPAMAAFAAELSGDTLVPHISLDDETDGRVSSSLVSDNDKASTPLSAPGTFSPDQARKEVGEPGAGSTARLLRSDGTKGRLRPDMDDFVPMTELFDKR